MSQGFLSPGSVSSQKPNKNLSEPHLPPGTTPCLFPVRAQSFNELLRLWFHFLTAPFSQAHTRQSYVTFHSIETTSVKDQ